MAAKRALPEAVVKYYSTPKPDIFSRGVPARLPETYKTFFKEWKAPSTIPVHYYPEEGKWKRNPLTGEVTPIQNVPIPIKYPKEFDSGLWGGEGVIFGYIKKRGKYTEPLTKWRFPNLLRSAVYSEIFDARLSVVVTKRTIQLIIDHKGFDNYILETKDRDLMSLLALKLKKKMLLALFDKTLYPNDPIKREKVYNKYKHHLDQYNREDLEWYALSIGEAVKKLMDEEDAIQPKPLKHEFRADLIEELKTIASKDQLNRIFKEDEDKSKKSWLSRMNPFVKVN